MPRVRPGPFKDIKTAPKDGTVIEVIHGPQQSVTRAYWFPNTQAFVRADDTVYRTLHRVTGWRPAE